jgi:hypothetical protein
MALTRRRCSPMCRCTVMARMCPWGERAAPFRAEALVVHHEDASQSRALFISRIRPARLREGSPPCIGPA